ncbi:MAG: HEAT repeat domain-containing protein [Phycisphaerales bacterium]|nr:HEAT repeat domain-containing protein [Phycisphaerales bacterium]
MKRTALLAIAVFVLLTGHLGCDKAPPTRHAERQNKRLEALIAGLKSDSKTNRIRAAEKLANMGSVASGAAADIIEAMDSDDAELRAYAARALGRICQPAAGSAPPQADTVVPALRKKLADPDAMVRVWSAFSLFQILPDADPEIKVLADVVQTRGDAQARIQAAVAIGEMGPRGKGAVPALIAALSSRSVNRHAAYALGMIGPDAKDAIGALLRLSGRSGPAADAARTALEHIRK